MKARNAHADEALNGERVRAQRARQRAAEQGDDRAEHRQNEDPQQHRAFVEPPDAGDLVDRRHRAVRILRDVENGKIRRQMRIDERCECNCDQRELGQRGAAPDLHKLIVADARAPQRRPVCASAAQSASTSAKCPISTIMVWRRPPLPASGPVSKAPPRPRAAYSAHRVWREWSRPASRRLSRRPSATTPWPSRNKSGSRP